MNRTHDSPARRPHAGREAISSEGKLGKPQAGNPIIEDPIRSIEMGKPMEPSERRLSETSHFGVQRDEFIAWQDTANGQVTLTSKVSTPGGAATKFLKPLTLLAPHVRKILFRPATGSPLVAGTDVPEANVVELMKALRERSVQPAGWGARLAGRLLLQLILERAPGPVTVEGVKVEQLKRLIDLLSQIESPETGAGMLEKALRSAETPVAASGQEETSFGEDGEHKD